MIHKLTIGHFDVEDLRSGKLVALRAVDMGVVTRLLQEFGEASDDGLERLGGHTVEVKDGYIICPWLMPMRIQRTEEFAKRLCQETGCVMFDQGRREVVTAERLGPDW